jgi:hypothetical protein
MGMPGTGTRGITVDNNGLRTINKEHRGERIFARLRACSREPISRSFSFPS